LLIETNLIKPITEKYRATVLIPAGTYKVVFVDRYKKEKYLYEKISKIY